MSTWPQDRPSESLDCSSDTVRYCLHVIARGSCARPGSNRNAKNFAGSSKLPASTSFATGALPWAVRVLGARVSARLDPVGSPSLLFWRARLVGPLRFHADLPVGLPLRGLGVRAKVLPRLIHLLPREPGSFTHPVSATANDLIEAESGRQHRASRGSEASKTPAVAQMRAAGSLFASEVIDVYGEVLKSKLDEALATKGGT